MGHTWVSVELDVLFVESQFVFQERVRACAVLVLDNGIRISVSLEHFQRRRGGCSERCDFCTEWQPGGQCSNTSNCGWVSETCQQRNCTALTKASDDDAFARDLVTV